jgi:hypothetical protein
LPLVPKKGERPVNDALSQELAAGVEAATKEVSLITDGVRYGVFADLDPPLSVGEFLDLRAVAIMRRLFGYNEFRIAERLGKQRSTVDQLLAHPNFTRIDGVLLENVRRVGGATSLDELVKEVGVRAGKEAALMALGGPAREKASAIAALVDRVSPKQGRREKPSNARVFPANLLATIKLGMELERNRNADSRGLVTGESGSGDDVVDAEIVGGGEIDAGILNVPRA